MNKELICYITKNAYGLDWHGTDQEITQASRQAMEAFYADHLKDPHTAIFYLGYKYRQIDMSESLSFLHKLSEKFSIDLSKIPEIEFLREKTILEIDSETASSLTMEAPYMTGIEFVDHDWLKSVWDLLNKAFASLIHNYEGRVQDFLASLKPDIHIPGRVYFHLVESKKDDMPFAFLATYSKIDTITGRIKHLPLKNALTEYEDDTKKLLELLSTVSRASQKSEFVKSILDNGEIFHPIGLTSGEAYTFLKEVELYSDSGILCRIPNWWKSRSSSIKLSVSIGEKAPSKLGFNSLVSFDISLAIGDEKLSTEQIEELLAETQGLAYIKGKWVEVDKKKLEDLLMILKKAESKKQPLDLLQAMRLNLDPAKMMSLTVDEDDLQITNGRWLGDTLKRLTDPASREEILPGDNFKASLRAYQTSGLSWLYLMKLLGLGACLADDMGLGKTIQVLALLNHFSSCSREKTLLVVPASLIGNWVNEINKFAPELKYAVLHPSEYKGREIPLKPDTEDGIFITTYGMVLRYKELKEIEWDNLIIDEAQAIKNPSAKQTKALKQLKSNYRLALTGTPIENRLSDLWSLFDFLNKGLLGTDSEFSSYIKALKESSFGYSHLKKAVSPFILRRVKTDKNVISDLPDKIEMKTYSTLTKKQAALYSALVDEIKEKLESTSDDIARKGLILSSIMKFKQICNHPDQYLGQSTFSYDESGKYEVLKDICSTIYEKRERVLVFTQFKEMTEPLRNFLESIFEHKGLVIHGSIPVPKRKKIVDEFQSDNYVPFLVLSIKAGGTGLNLTSANHVIHFDRWWNPAVEDQATDRAFRIGQHKNVIVHKFITGGTIEEKIDLMIEDKIKLSRDIISDNKETWITEFDDKQLIEMMSLKI